MWGARHLTPCSLDDIFVVQKFNWLGGVSAFPHQREKPSTAFANTKIRRRKSHLGIERRFFTRRSIFGLPAKRLATPRLTFRMQVRGKAAHLVQIGNRIAHLGPNHKSEIENQQFRFTHARKSRNTTCGCSNAIASGNASSANQPNAFTSSAARNAPPLGSTT